MTVLHPASGQSLLETAIALPILLALLAGGYWGFRGLSLEGAAMSAAQTQLLRAGRGQPGLGSKLSTSILPGGKGVSVSARNGSLAKRVPPFAGLAGRTVSSVEVSRRKEGAGAFLELPDHEIRSCQEGAVDCWGSGSLSGRNVRRTVLGIVSTGALR